MKTVISFILVTFVVISLEAEIPSSLSIDPKSVVIEDIAFIKIGTYSKKEVSYS